MDNRRGKQQYLDIGRAVENNSDVRTLIKQLETYYDRVLAGATPAEQESLAPDVERFLRDVTDRLDGDKEGRDEDASEEE